MLKTIETISLSCHRCGKRQKITDSSNRPLPHKTPNADVVRWFRRHGWSCDDNGCNALCPCRKGEIVHEVGNDD